MLTKAKAALVMLAVLFLAILHVTCNQAILTAPTNTGMTIIVNPPSIKANGGVSVITVILIEGGAAPPATTTAASTGGSSKSVAAFTGTPVADGTVVQFFTNLGIIDEQAKTNDGVARANLRSDARSGTATITAISGPVSSTGTVTIGNARASRVFLTANPTRLIEQRASRIVATVIDINGNPVEDVAVIFRIEQPLALPPTPFPGDEVMESRGTPVFTDNNGQAIDVMRTGYPPDAASRNVNVIATVLVSPPIESLPLRITIN
jgi:hypothetical protein